MTAHDPHDSDAVRVAAGMLAEIEAAKEK